MQTINRATFNRILLLMLLGISLPLFTTNATGSGSRVMLPKPSSRPQTKPTPKPTPTKPQTEQLPEQSEAIRITSNLVALPVSVTDKAGQPVRNLTAANFQIEEEGQVQQVVTLGEPGKTPVELVLLFDVSGSVKERFDFEQQAAARFLRQVLKAHDTASIFTLGVTPKLAQARAQNIEQIVQGVLAIRPTREATAFFDAVVAAAQHLRDTAESGTRRVIVVISDGEDTVSEKNRLADALRELQRSDSIFYAINPSGPSIHLNKISLKGHEWLTTLSAATGGTTFLPDRLEDLDAVFRQITAELQAQYLLGYYSSDERTDGGFRKIAVRVSSRPDLRVRSRQGYYAPRG